MKKEDFKKKKKAQIGETLTWIVATIIIVLLLSSLFGKAKKVSVEKDSLFSKTYSRTNDLVLEESVFTYFLIKDKSKQDKIYDNLKKEEKENKFYVNLDEKIEEVRGVLND